MNEITGTAQAHRGAIMVEVFPGGALSALTLSKPALALGAPALAASILDAVAEAATLADARLEVVDGTVGRRADRGGRRAGRAHHLARRPAGPDHRTGS